MIFMFMVGQRGGLVGTPGNVRIGISGWRYAPWRGVFYPKQLPQKKELAFASSAFRTIEINGTFYSLQRPGNFAAWAAETAADFVFAVKGPRFITHIRRLKEVRAPLANFLASGMLRLGEKLGPILWQLPPNFRFDSKRVEAFLKMLPQDTEQAASIAQRHDKRVTGRAWMKTDAKRTLRHAIEIRHTSFVSREFVDMLECYKTALVCADSVAWPRLMDLTADFVYCRLHGSEELYTSRYDGKTLDEWAVRVAAWARGGEPSDAERVAKGRSIRMPRRDVYVYFDNDAKVRAPFDAKQLIVRVRKRLAS